MPESSQSNEKFFAVVWSPEEHRTANFARYLNAKLYNIHYLFYKRPWIAPFKYVLQWWKTWYVLFKNRPHIIFVTNPPVFAALCVAAYCAVTRNVFIMDTHSPAIFSRKWGWTVPLQRFVARYAIVNIVDQTRFEELFESWGAKAFILRAPPPNQDLISIAHGTPVDENFSILVVNTFAVDEPLMPVLDAARMQPDVQFYIVGDLSIAPQDIVENAPPNVKFTGYLWNDTYWSYVGRVRAVISLTTYPHSLLSGAQEGLWARKPIIISRQPALEDNFTKGTVFVEHTGENISQAIDYVKANEAQLKQEIVELGEEFRDLWDTKLAELKDIIRDNS